MMSTLFSYRRCLIPLSLGITLSGWSAAGLAAPNPLVEALAEADDAAGAAIAQVEAETPDNPDPLRLDAQPTPASPAREGLEPGEEAVPLSIDGDGEVLPDPSQSGLPLPQSDRPTDEGFEVPPEYLTPEANPLLVPTRPEEVEIVGTQPLSLETAIELAYRNSEQLRIALLQLERSQSGLRAERASLYPTVDLSGSLQTTNQSSSGGESQFGGGDITTTTASSTLRTDYDLGLSGERSARISAAERQVRLSELQVEQTREDLRLNTITDYYAVQEAIEQIRINQAFLDEAERNLRDSQLREEVGVGTRFDVLRAEVQVANARQTLTQAASQRQIAQRQLSRRLNVPPAIELTSLAVNIAGAWPLSLEESIVLAFQNRAELEQFLVEREFNDAQRRISLAAVRPRLGVFGQYGLQSLLSSSTGASSSLGDGFSLGAQLSWRLFDAGAARARATQNELDIQTDEFEFESTRNDIRVQVEESYYTLVANQANIDTASVAVNQAEEALELATLRFNAGVGTQLDVLTATRELAEAEGNLVTAVLDYNRALARLERAVSNLASPAIPDVGL
ncbi:TolC family protein [Nodosilinea sp. LEGE 07298]|uniref:TolC family protein n=1 Tax=Nodosilinea sp. LEGE 07298 TaxID=2777970 RepID=UPI0018827BA5|nr:TolC family protein [Nodosilinea sp. LEGE 07298]MBE9109785.1 TolC family protein [Nodosilinea sp. LEGE 07298]